MCVITLVLISLIGCEKKQEERVKCSDYILDYMAEKKWILSNEENAEFTNNDKPNIMWSIVHDYLFIDKGPDFYDLDIRNNSIYKDNDFKNNVYDTYKNEVEFDKLKSELISIHEHLEYVGCPVYGQSPDILLNYKELEQEKKN
jgi:hypothetical protein